MIGARTQQFFTSQLFYLMQPSPRVTDAELCEKARLLRFTLLIGCVTDFFVILLFLFNPPMPRPEWVTAMAMLVVFIVLHRLAWHGYVRLTASVLVITMLGLIIVVPFTPNSLESLPFFIIIPMMLMGVFFSKQYVVVMTASVCLAIIVLTGFITPDDFWQAPMIEKLILIVAVGGVIVVFVQQRDILEKSRRVHQQQLFEQMKVSSKQALTESEQRFASAFRISFMPMVITTIDREAPRYVEANQAYQELVGYSWDELRGRNLLDMGVVINDEKRAERVRVLDNIGYYKEKEITLYTRSGDVRDVLVSSQRTRIGEGVYELEIMLDITERRKAQQREFEIALEKERTRLLTVFVQKASHEFRTPLSVIGTSVYLLGKQRDDDKRQGYIEQVNHQISRLDMLLSMMVLMTRLESGVALDMQRTDLSQCLHDFLAASQRQVANHRLHHSIADSLWVICDADWMIKALYQLLDNAVRYTPPSSTITLLAHRVDGGVCIELSDTGEGMDNDTLAHIFDQFWRYDEAHSTPGFGLGLSIAKRIVEMHNGVIEVESVVGVGSRFRIQLAEQV